MTANPITPNPAIDDAPISASWKSPRDVFVAIAEKSQRDPELVALAESVAVELDRYLDGAITLRDFARAHTPYQRFRAVRVWGPLSPYFPLMMPVLDDLIALHRSGKTTERPQHARRPDVPVVAAAGRFECAHCYREQYMSQGAPQLCSRCRVALGTTGTEGD